MNCWRRAGNARRYARVDAGLAVFVLLMAIWELGLVVSEHGSALAAAACLGMVLPAAIAPRHPVAATVTMTAFCALNNFALGHIVRCGPFFLCLFYVTFECARRRPLLTKCVGFLSALTSIEVQVRYDPVLGQDQFLFITGVMAPFFVAGLVAGVRSQMVVRLRGRTLQLLEEREATARLAVAADREELSAALIDQLSDGLRQICELTGSGPAAATMTLVDIEHHAREVMDQMRRSVRTVRMAQDTTEPAEASA